MAGFWFFSVQQICVIFGRNLEFQTQAIATDSRNETHEERQSLDNGEVVRLLDTTFGSWDIFRLEFQPNDRNHEDLFYFCLRASPRSTCTLPSLSCLAESRQSQVLRSITD